MPLSVASEPISIGDSSGEVHEMDAIQVVQKVLKHLAFIMDGNRRFAKKLSTMISLGHARGGDTLERIIEYSYEARIPYVSFWALSKENILERNSIEIAGIYKLLRKKIPNMVENFQKNNIQLEVIGDFSLLPHDIAELLQDSIQKTQTPDPQMTVILAIAYSGQDEIVRAVKKCIKEGIDPETLTEAEFMKHLDTGKFPPPDGIVRTGGDIRHSGFHLFQSAYSEYYFTDTLWPELDQAEFQKIVQHFRGVKRNFGK